AKLLKTDAVKVTPPQRQAPPAFNAFMEARKEGDPKARAGKLRDILKESKPPGDPTMAGVYTALLMVAEPGGLDAAAVKPILDEWLAGAAPYGNEYQNTVAAQAVAALAGQKTLAPLTLELAQRLDKGLGADAPAANRAEVVRALAEAARAAGKAEIAAEAEGRLAKLDAELDATYRKTVPPFAPERPAAAKRESDRVVLLELFTGAECPPCGAAHVAFDAQNQVYTPGELVALQYHLHIPGPDPLTNPDSEKRAQYYPDFAGTPTTIFDGKPDAMGGGQMPQAKAKFDEFRDVLERLLATPSRAAIDLKVERDGDAIRIAATATVKDPDEAGAGKIGGSKPTLRLVLVEEEVRYPGRNGLRFHHHVVRAMPGGADGKALTNGRGKVEAAVKLAELRQSLETYLSDFSKGGRNFPKP
ncbi:MAG: hypothetical protein K2X91_05035, partial [Thermoleophilia bacterium]|nr:hypothetical protein [Thermoleophilia bacterium]